MLPPHPFIFLIQLNFIGQVQRVRYFVCVRRVNHKTEPLWLWDSFKWIHTNRHKLLLVNSEVKSKNLGALKQITRKDLKDLEVKEGFSEEGTLILRPEKWMRSLLLLCRLIDSMVKLILEATVSIWGLILTLFSCDTFTHSSEKYIYWAPIILSKYKYTDNIFYF